MLKKSVWNILGQLLPLIAALICVPILIDRLGLERFGMLTLVWIVIGYFSLFDFGVGRAATKLVAERLNTAYESELPKILSTSVATLIAIGLTIAIVGYFSVPFITNTISEPTADHYNETKQSLKILILATPVVVLSVGLRGVVEGFARFDISNIIRIPTGILNFVAPAVVLAIFDGDLLTIVIILAVIRCIACYCFFIAVNHLASGSLSLSYVDRKTIGLLVRFGGWVSVSSIVSPLMVYGDRFLMAGMLSATAVTYYATPYDLVTRLWFIPVALAGVIFPAFSALQNNQEAERTKLFSSAVRYILALMFSVTFMFIINAKLGLAIWLGEEFAMQSAAILQIIAFGVLVNSTAQIPFALIQASGKPKITAILHIIEIPFYILALILVIPVGGIIGVAVVWVARILVDTALLFRIAHVNFGVCAGFHRSLLKLFIATVFYIPGFAPLTVTQQLGYSIFALLFFTAVFWRWVLLDEHKAHAKTIMGGYLKK